MTNTQFTILVIILVLLLVVSYMNYNILASQVKTTQVRTVEDIMNSVSSKMNNSSDSDKGIKSVNLTV